MSSSRYDDKEDDKDTNNRKVTPQSRLELSVAPSDGSLLTAPLSLILNTATDALYTDLHAMVTGEPLTLYLPSTTETSTEDGGGGAAGGGGDGGEDHHHNYNDPNSQQLPYTTKVEAMFSLSFQQRRHILASRIARRVKSFSHVSALVAANLPTSSTAPGPGSFSSSSTLQSTSSSKTKQQQQQQRYPNLYAMSQIPPEHELNQITQVASRALEHVRTSWVSADIAQDAMYFHHDTLWKIRSHPHDVLGAMEVLLKGTWGQMSQDVRLNDRYRDSVERSWDKKEMRERLRSAVRRKLVLGELGHGRQRGVSGGGNDFQWNVVLEKDGTSIRVHHGKPRKEGKDIVYPMEARLTVLSESDTLPLLEQQRQQQQNNNNDEGEISQTKSQLYPYPAPWTLLSIQIKTSVKTGESNHQLELSKEQMFGFHQICERAMMKEEIRAKKVRDAKARNDGDKNGHGNGSKIGNGSGSGSGSGHEELGDIVARPLEKLLHMSHEFSISWQMEILSSQAEALRKGSWASRQGGGGGGTTSSIAGGASSNTRGAGGGGSGGGGNNGEGSGIGIDGVGITVAPVRFLTEDEQWEWRKESDNNGGMNGSKRSGKKVRVKPLAYLAIHFWEIDDRNGKPQIGPLYDLDNNSGNVSDRSFTAMSLSDDAGAKRLTLEIRAVPGKGLEVSLSGGSTVMSLIENKLQDHAGGYGYGEGHGHGHGQQNNSYLERNVHMLLSSLQDPFELSVGNALLAAVVICADRRCRAIVNALLKTRQGNSTNMNVNAAISSSSSSSSSDGDKSLPPWMHLSVECGSIAVSVKMSYYGKKEEGQDQQYQQQGGTCDRAPVLLFRLACDSRTGRFIPTFPRATSLLRHLVCNDPSASEIQQLHQIKAMSAGISASALASSTSSTLSASDKRRAAARAKELTGRTLRYAFTSLTRSFDILGRRVGVGEWNDIDTTSFALREKSIAQACGDVCVSLMSCAGMSAVYGVGALAIGVAGGTNALPDIGGRPIEPQGGISYIPAPPLSVVTSQEMVESTIGNTTTMKLEREMYGITASVTKESLSLHLFDMLTQIDSVTSPPNRIECKLIPLESIDEDGESEELIQQRRVKRQRLDANNSDTDDAHLRGASIFQEVGYLAKRLNKTWKALDNNLE